MADLRIPSGPRTITAEWLTQTLRSTGTIADAEVESFDIETIGEGKGFTGHLARLRLNYDLDERNAPGSLVAKFPVSNPKTRTLLNYARLYEREIRFYKEIAARVELRTPRCYYSALDVEDGGSVLLLEDLGQARLVSDVAGCSLEDAQHAVCQLAKFHAAWWNNPRLEEITWMPAFSDGADSLQKLYQKLWNPYIEKIRGTLPAPFIELGGRLGRNVAKLCRGLAEPPRTMAHGDYRLDNIFFGFGGNDASLTVIDWQLAMRGRGVSDVAYFLLHSVPSNQRRSMEMHLLKSYHSTLLESGVCGYEFDQCLNDYRISVLHTLVRMVVREAFLDLSSVPGQALRETLLRRLRRCAVAMEDHNVAELIE